MTRPGKGVTKNLSGITTYYIRDAQGNTLALYDNTHSTINWKEQDLYGSSRLGLWQPNLALSTGNGINAADTIGKKVVELDNHLGNVMVTITDKRIQHTTNNTSVDYFNADISTSQEYYAFGGLMPSRTYTALKNYRYGFNGKENDNDVKGTGNQIDYGARIYDPRRAGFDSVDPLSNKYPELTPYQFAANKPIFAVDIDGNEDTPYDFGRAESDIREESAKLYKIDPRLSKEFEQNGNVLGITVIGGFLTAGYGASLLEAGGFKALLSNMLRGGAVGAGVSASISWAKGDNGYEIVKSATSGFFSGAILGMGWTNSVSSILIGGGISGGVGEIVNQEFDDKFGGQKGFDLEKIAISGGVGSVANLLSNAIVNRINKAITNNLSESLAATRSSAYKKIIRNAILEKSPRIGNKELSITINTEIKTTQNALIKQAAASKVAVQQAVDRAIDKLQDKYKNQ